MDAIDLHSIAQLQEVDNASRASERGVVIFKHSTRCAISGMALGRFRREWNMDQEQMPVFLLDLLRNREVSNEIAKRYNIPHESPQVLLIKGGEAVYTASHYSIRAQDLEEYAHA